MHCSLCDAISYVHAFYAVDKFCAKFVSAGCASCSEPHFLQLRLAVRCTVWQCESVRVAAPAVRVSASRTFDPPSRARRGRVRPEGESRASLVRDPPSLACLASETRQNIVSYNYFDAVSSSFVNLPYLARLTNLPESRQIWTYSPNSDNRYNFQILVQICPEPHRLILISHLCA